MHRAVPVALLAIMIVHDRREVLVLRRRRIVVEHLYRNIRRAQDPSHPVDHLARLIHLVQIALGPAQLQAMPATDYDTHGCPPCSRKRFTLSRSSVGMQWLCTCSTISALTRVSSYGAYYA